MRKLSMPKRMLSGAFAAALACTMCPLAAVSTPEVAHAVTGDATATRVEPINVTAPVAVIFGGSGYDVSNPQPSITTTTTFNNAGTQPIYISKLECTDNNSGKILEKTGSTELADQKMFSMYPSSSNDGFDRTVSFGVGTGTQLAAGDIGSKFFIDAGKSLDCTFRLNLANSAEVENASLKVKAAAGEAEITADSTLRSLAKVKYTFASYPTATTANKSDLDMYLEDKLTNRTLDFNEINKNAKSISDDEMNSPYYELYYSYARNWRSDLYEGKVKVDGVARSYKVIGINTHNVAVSDTEASSKKAGVAFEIQQGGIQAPFFAGYTTQTTDSRDIVKSDWRYSLLRAKMNPDKQDFYGINYEADGSKPYANADDDGVWNLFPSQISNEFVPVLLTDYLRKASGQPYTTVTSSNRLFVNSAYDLGDLNSGNNGGIYQFYQERYKYQIASRSTASSEDCAKGNECRWYIGLNVGGNWLRSSISSQCDPNSAGYRDSTDKRADGLHQVCYNNVKTAAGKNGSGVDPDYRNLNVLPVFYLGGN